MGWMDTYQYGGVIEDNRGQWAHPGKITRINSNDITMKGVNYPVLGISNTGDKQLMMPGKDYKFDGESVTEYPMAQSGMNINNIKKSVSPTEKEMKGVKDYIYDLEYNTPIRDREDFKGNLLSKIGTRRSEAYGNLGDLYNYYSSIPTKNNALFNSKYKPTDSKNPDAKYIAIKDDNFRNQVLYHANRIFIDKDTTRLNISDVSLSGRDRKINDYTYSVSAYNYNNKHKNNINETAEERAIGRYFVSKGKDDEGEYISYYDEFDANQPAEGLTLTEKLGITKPFEIYDRIYTDRNSTGRYTVKNKKFKNGGWLDKY